MKRQGFSLIEVIVVVSIMGILITLFVTTFTGQRSKNTIEGNIKLLYSDLAEMRVKAMAENKAYGIAWTLSASNDFQSYNMNGDTNSNDNITDTGGFVTIRTTTLSGTYPVAPLSTMLITSITFNNKGICMNAECSSTPGFQLYSSCTDCDSSGLPADTSVNCDNINYPEYSCLFVSSTRIKMGKWCDSNGNGTFDSGECTIK
ncbi:MAG: type II secretion system protein [Nitrospirae bacterium]|nr:type II secretion system protein [Nitrospirota bacterium]MBF0534884.1 type II secretion system protein [Nitrospirota bacterium]MBF0616799.1 type II secretion system protein [Nitrospirota bacterium]